MQDDEPPDLDLLLQDDEPPDMNLLMQDDELPDMDDLDDLMNPPFLQDDDLWGSSCGRCGKQL
jgi:hypothetical protein